MTPNLSTNHPSELRSDPLERLHNPASVSMEHCIEAFDHLSDGTSRLQMKTPPPEDDPDISRFKNRLTAAVSELIDYTKRVPHPNFVRLPRKEKAMSQKIFSLLNKSKASSLVNSVSQSIPESVQKVLGKESPSFDDLIALPKPETYQLKKWLVYFDGLVQWEISGLPEDRRKTGRVLQRSKYVGSSTDARGGGARIQKHETAAISKQSGEKAQRHHKELCRDGAEANIRILATFDMDDDFRSQICVLETIFMALIGTFVGQERTGTHNPLPCYDLYDRMRSRMAMPDIDGIGLNGALPIHQGTKTVFIGQRDFACINCNLELLVNTSARDHSRLVEPGTPQGPRRCGACDRHFGIYGVERVPRNSDGSFHWKSANRQDHAEWVAENNMDQCGNEACAAPRVPGASFSGWKEESRCGVCFAFLAYQKNRGIPENELKERTPTRKEILAREHVWTSEEDELLLLKCDEGIKFSAIVAEFFPQLTAQIARERKAKLTSKKRPKRSDDGKAIRAKKSPDWTELEIKVVRDGLMEKKKPKELLSVLPGRTSAAIVSKMTSMRKVLSSNPYEA